MSGLREIRRALSRVRPLLLEAAQEARSLGGEWRAVDLPDGYAAVEWRPAAEEQGQCSLAPWREAAREWQTVACYAGPVAQHEARLVAALLQRRAVAGAAPAGGAP